MAQVPISLVCMPWHLLGSPSIQLGILESLLAEAGLACRSHSLYLAFQEELEAEDGGSFTFDDYADVCSRWQNVGAGEWVFADTTPARDARYARLARRRGMPRETLTKLRALRARVPAFLERCADEVLAGEPSVVGFTTVYSQTWPSVALARVLKRRDPSLRVVFGGASCEGPMGSALLRAFPEIDVVARGEAEATAIELMESLVAGRPVPPLAGVCHRDAAGRLVEQATHPAPRVELDAVPIPRFEEYFERLARSPLLHRILPQIPFESSRGCWWGARSHCTFCGLNGMDMAFRSKSAERVHAEVAAQASRHGVLDFTSMDNILDMRYFTTLLPRLAADERDFSFFYETKANLSESHVRELRASGVTSIQPGIESLSTPILKLMRKGVTALQNVRLLKWCAQHDVRVIWNLLYGFPNEPAAEYARMAELVPSLVHLPAPHTSRLEVYRFSPYFDRPAEHGIELVGPLPYYHLLYEADAAALRDLAQAFDYRHADGRDPDAYAAPLLEQLDRWRADADANRGALTYRRGPDFLVITDTRTTTGAAARYTLSAAEAAAYLACEAGATAASIADEVERIAPGVLSPDALDALLCDLAGARLLVEEDGRHLALALRKRPGGESR